MIKIGITGSIASGKTTASQILSYKRGPLFSADAVVNSLYKQISLQKEFFAFSVSERFRSVLFFVVVFVFVTIPSNSETFGNFSDLLKP